jgi:hypothetical protein
MSSEKLKLQAIVVSINYSDFLKITLPNNKQYFDKLVVVTDTKDLETAKVCNFYNVKCIQTDAFYSEGEIVPNKAKGINEGLKDLDLDAWIIQMDADIWLPPLTRDILEHYPLEKDSIYGIDRFMCNSYEDWIDFIHMNKKEIPNIHEGWIYLHMDHFPIGQRIVQYYGEGYMPIGYFQLWHPNGSKVISYPVELAGFDRTDVLHLKQFPREKRRFIPDLVCIHLASEEHEMGQNWGGRRTKKFIPTKKTSAFKGISIYSHHLSKNHGILKSDKEEKKSDISATYLC